MSQWIPQASRITRCEGLETSIRFLFGLGLRPLWECWVAGAPASKDDCRLHRELNAIAAGVGISERIGWLGFRSDLPDLLKAADLYRQLKEVDKAFGLSLVEAMLARLPVVGPACGGLAENLEPAGVAMVIPGDHRELGSRPLRLLTNPDRRIASAMRGREIDAAGHEPDLRTGEHRGWRPLVSETGTAGPKAWHS